ncbi:hypothetical protein QBC33DRAFT_558904 [Phialemonium atrogriseum]|uniref:Uncharacterized protein n=1 Tax=Phialemonium atrogriseum TaxID=1093897 RepID=A0AAJ0BZZ6_9PEZI|nr:uncharacterized protein QBC33DRAFT_558904 [Phialemonium atrogriseum]KAK1767425.1 hypothetical protein QBC33DRAFT_558904 [Phialemonium atrogriseum]
MAPWGMLIRAILVLEDAIVSQILRSPRFHHGVRRIHRTVEDYRHGRDPNEPLRPGEATEDPNLQKRSFFGYFADEIRNQIRGTPTNPPGNPPPGPPSAPKK